PDFCRSVQTHPMNGSQLLKDSSCLVLGIAPASPREEPEPLRDECATFPVVCHGFGESFGQLIPTAQQAKGIQTHPRARPGTQVGMFDGVGTGELVVEQQCPWSSGDGRADHILVKNPKEKRKPLHLLLCRQKSQDVVRMANFKGHALPGSFFLVFGLWWSVKYPLRYLSQKASKKSQKNYFFQRVDAIEGGVKITFALIGMLAEQFVPDGPHLYLYSGEKRDWVKLMNWQHTTMYLFYGLSGVVDIFTYSCSVVPRGLDRLMLSIAVFVEGACSTMLEVFLRDNIVLEMFRAGVTIVQGTWFWQVGVVLFQPWGGPMWDESDHSNIMFLTMCFFWHWAAAVVIVAVNYSIAYSCMQRCWRGSGEPYISLGVRKQEGDRSSQAAFLNGSDEE
ncbi:UNVERIFIED_CONTAM: hypothetical protein H355_014297, partial [Colinus virginianus]